jgi:hypothetical protein
MLPSEFFAKYSFKEISEAKFWVEENYEVNTQIKTVWHPVIRLFCELKNAKLAVNPEVFINIEFSAGGSHD